jgi:hypothetical protein
MKRGHYHRFDIGFQFPIRSTPSVRYGFQVECLRIPPIEFQLEKREGWSPLT